MVGSEQGGRQEARRQRSGPGWGTPCGKRLARPPGGGSLFQGRGRAWLLPPALDSWGAGAGVLHTCSPASGLSTLPASREKSQACLVLGPRPAPGPGEAPWEPSVGVSSTPPGGCSHPPTSPSPPLSQDSIYIFREGALPPYRQMFYQLCDLNVDEYVREGPRDAEVGTLGLGDRGVACSSRPARRGLCPGSRGPGSTFQAAVRASARGWVFAFLRSCPCGGSRHGSPSPEPSRPESLKPLIWLFSVMLEKPGAAVGAEGTAER